MTRALDGVSVLDLSDSMAAAWCTRLLADNGADIVLVEPLEGLRIRQFAPFDERERSIAATYVLANKQSIALDLDEPESARVIGELLEAVDVVVHSGWSAFAERGLDLDRVHASRPELVSISVTANGETGPRSDLPGNDLTAYAWSGWASVNGRADREPLKGSGYTASFTAGTSAYGAVITALCHRELTGRGQHIDIAEADSMATIFSRSMLRAQYEGELPRRNSESQMSSTYPGRVRDGYVTAGLNRGARLAGALRAVGLDDLASSISADAPARASADPEVMRALNERLAELDPEEVFDLLSPLHITVGPVLDAAALMENQQMQARDWFRPPAEGGDVAFPGSPFSLSATPAELRTTAPEIGEHSDEALTRLLGRDRQLLQRGVASGETA